jgi:riboflavin synthase
MFSGIVTGLGIIENIEKQNKFRNIRVRLPKGTNEHLSQGASVSLDGVCLTVVEFSEHTASFDIIDETLNRTTLSKLEVGDMINVERSLKFGEEIGGHQVSGHIDQIAEITDINNPENNHIVRMKIPSKYMPYIIEKGYIALDGCSLTIANVFDDGFNVCLIPETLRRTTFGFKKEGDFVNFEIEAATKAIVDSYDRMRGGR